MASIWLMNVFSNQPLSLCQMLIMFKLKLKYTTLQTHHRVIDLSAFEHDYT